MLNSALNFVHYLWIFSISIFKLMESYRKCKKCCAEGNGTLHSFIDLGTPIRAGTPIPVSG